MHNFPFSYLTFNKNKAKAITVILLLLTTAIHPLLAQKRVCISGTVTDFDNHPIAGSDVFVQDKDFKDLYHVKCDKKGQYVLRIPAGEYPYLSAIREANYPQSPHFNGNVTDARLEFWSWGFIADRDTTLNLRYQRMEVYGVNVFSVQGGSATYQIYVRPMSLTRTAQWMTDRSKPAHFAPEADKLKAEVTIDGEPVKVLLKQPVREFATAEQTLDAYLLTVAMPTKKASKPYRVFRIVLEDMENGDKGEALYYMK